MKDLVPWILIAISTLVFIYTVGGTVFALFGIAGLILVPSAIFFFYTLRTGRYRSVFNLKRDVTASTSVRRDLMESIAPAIVFLIIGLDLLLIFSNSQGANRSEIAFSLSAATVQLFYFHAIMLFLVSWHYRLYNRTESHNEDNIFSAVFVVNLVSSFLLISEAVILEFVTEKRSILEIFVVGTLYSTFTGLTSFFDVKTNIIFGSVLLVSVMSTVLLSITSKKKLSFIQEMPAVSSLVSMLFLSTGFVFSIASDEELLRSVISSNVEVLIFASILHLGVIFSKMFGKATLHDYTNLGKRIVSSSLFLVSLLFLFLGMIIQGGDTFLLMSLGVLVAVNSLSGYRNRQRLERIIRTRTLELEKANAMNEQLLLNILPEPIAKRLKDGETTIADSFASVSVIFADIVGFTKMASRLTASEIVELLDELFRMIDLETRELGIEKIKTIGDCYMAVAGIPVSYSDHADRAVALGQRILSCVSELNKSRGLSLQVRIGINSGEVIAGVIGKHKYIYDLWGDAVNTASRMESNGRPGSITISEETKKILTSVYELEFQGNIDIKGKGVMPVWSVIAT